ncbi:MAG TPA: hypothetical protein VF625_03125 [Longimicrobium sp.]|jgi:hypothetical protein
MGELVFASTRRFELWIYHVSHGQLLLRSNRTSEDATRVEILFVNVLSMHLPTLIETLEIEIADAGASAEILSNMGAWELDTEKVFLVRGRNCRGHVLAGGIFWNEDDVYFPGPSALMELPGTPGIVV